jgi:hypothetical protein
MSEHASPTDDSAAGPEADASWSTNGRHVDDPATEAETEAAAEAQAEVGAQSDAADSGEIQPDAEPIGDQILPEAEPIAAEAEPATGSEPVAAAASDSSSFLANLVQAMQTTAGEERARLTEDTDRRREAHISTINARLESEADRMRELADEDIKGIDAWAESEQQRIQQEREERTAAVRDDLEVSLTAHRAGIDREIDAVEAAITAYRADVDAFFATFEQATDPVAIARHAGRRPAFPNLETLTPTPAETPAEEADEQPAVGVMDPSPASTSAWPSSVVGTSSSPEVDIVPLAEDADAVASGEELDAVPVAAGNAADAAQTPVIRSMPVSRPMGWLRRGDNDEDRANRGG